VYNSKVNELFSSHPKVFIVVDNNFPTQYSGPYGIGSAKFLIEVRNAQTFDGKKDLPSYVVYQSELITSYVFDTQPS